MRRLLLLLFGIALALAFIACAETPIDQVAWACVADDQCGSHRTCRAGLCVTSDGPLANGQACVTRAGKPSKDVRFTLLDANLLEVHVDGRSTTITLPEGVVGLADSPIDACCESPCCAAPKTDVSR